MKYSIESLATKNLQDINLRLLEKSSPVYPSALQDSIEQFWDKLQKQRPTVQPGPLFQAYSYSENTINHRTVELEVSKTITYKDVVGLRNTPHFLDNFISGLPPLSLSLIMMVHTCEDQLVLIERNSGDWPHSMELAGGFIIPEQGTLYEQMLTFLQTDLGLEEEHIDGHEIEGVIPYAAICEYMLVVSVRVQMTAAQLQEQSTKKVYIPSAAYRVEEQQQHFDLPLHDPSKTVLELHGY